MKLPWQGYHDLGPVVPADTVVSNSTDKGSFAGGLFTFRRPVPHWAAALLGLLCLALVLGIWWFFTRGPHEERFISYNSLPSPAETYNREQLEDLGFNNALTRNLLVSL